MQYNTLDMDTDFKCLAFILSNLNFIGLCPIQCDKSLQVRFYEFRWDSPKTIFGLCITAVVGFIHFISLTHGNLKWFFLFGPGMRHATNMAEEEMKKKWGISQQQNADHLIMLSAPGLIIICQYFCYLWTSWKNRHCLPQFLNASVSFQEKLPQSVIPNSYTNINYKIIMCGVVVFDISIAATFTYFTVSEISDHPDYWLEFIFSAIPWGCIGVYEVAHTAIMAFALRHLRHNFAQVRKNIETVAFEVNFAKWQSLVHSIRRQGALLSQYLTPAQLSSLAQTIILCTFCTFSALKMTKNGALQSFNELKDIKMFAANIVFEAWLVMSLFYKVVLAQNVTNEEIHLALELSQRNIKDPSVAFKVKQLADVMKQHPCEINLGDFVVLRKGLLLGVLSQVATYLIVIMQFYQ